MYREVKASERLPDKEGTYYVKLKEINRGVGRAMIFELHDIYTWLAGPELQQAEYWINTFESWLEPINVSEEEVADTLRADAIKHGYHWRPTAAKAIMNLLKDKTKQ